MAEIIATPKFKLAWHLVLNDFVDIRSKLNFGQTSKFCKQLVDESFKQTIHLSINFTLSNKWAKNFVLRCGLSLQTIEFDMPGFHFYDKEIAMIRVLAKQSPNLTKLPTVDFNVYRAYIESLPDGYEAKLEI